MKRFTSSILFAFSFFLFPSLSAMPTAEDLASVKPLVSELLKPDMDAMKAGKKSKADVAKASLALVAQADTPAAKLLLSRNAFNLYMKAGEFDDASAALDALLAAVPDYPADELQELLEKALYPVPSKKAPQIRARLAEIKTKAASAVQIKKLQALLAKTPDDPALNLRLATTYALADDWPRALPHFEKSSNADLAKAAKSELAAEPPAKTADLYWSCTLPKSAAKLESAVRTHAAALYTTALPTLTGLTKVQAERRIEELKSASTLSGTKPSESASSRFVQKKNSYVHFDHTFVDLGQPSKIGDRFEVEFSFDKEISGLRSFLFGVSPGGATSYCQKSAEDKFGPGCHQTPNPIKPGTRVRMSLVDGSSGLDINGESVAMPAFVMAAYAPQNNLQIGGYGNNNGNWKGNVYSFIWYRGGKPLVHLIPYKEGNRCGLKDKISGKIYSPDASSMALTYGVD